VEKRNRDREAKKEEARLQREFEERKEREEKRRNALELGKLNAVGGASALVTYIRFLFCVAHLVVRVALVKFICALYTLRTRISRSICNFTHQRRQSVRDQSLRAKRALSDMRDSAMRLEEERRSAEAQRKINDTLREQESQRADKREMNDIVQQEMQAATAQAEASALAAKRAKTAEMAADANARKSLFAALAP
jgi:hypothetical protein